MFVVGFRIQKVYLMLWVGLHVREFKTASLKEDHSVNNLNRRLPTGILKTGKTSAKLSLREYSLIITINKHNQKLINILENQKIYGGFLKILIFRVSLSRAHLQSKTLFYFVNGFWKVKLEISVF